MSGCGRGLRSLCVYTQGKEDAAASIPDGTENGARVFFLIDIL